MSLGLQVQTSQVFLSPAGTRGPSYSCPSPELVFIFILFPFLGCTSAHGNCVCSSLLCRSRLTVLGGSWSGGVFSVGSTPFLASAAGKLSEASPSSSLGVLRVWEGRNQQLGFFKKSLSVYSHRLTFLHLPEMRKHSGSIAFLPAGPCISPHAGCSAAQRCQFSRAPPRGRTSALWGSVPSSASDRVPLWSDSSRSSTNEKRLCCPRLSWQGKGCKGAKG